MKKFKNIIIIGGVLIIAIVIIVIGLKNRQDNTPAKIILFYGDTCPHCQIVRQYLDDNKVDQHLKFRELEVYHNPNNAKLLLRYAHQCGIDSAQGIGVPFLWTGENCLLGEQEVINFFKKQ